jgi:glutamate dehydrogenase (NAD(P)+)
MAAWMTLKAAVYNLPFGGSAGGITIDPAQHSRGELERISRRYVAELIDLLGPDEDILAPDVGTDTTVMAWFQDTYTMTKGQTSLAAVTGKPTAIGGVTVKDEAGGQGLVYALAGLAPVYGWQVSGARMAIQGFGQVGSAVARFAGQEGIEVVAVSSRKGGIYAPEGLNLEDLETYYAAKHSFEGFPGARPISNEELLKLEVDFLVPAAVENAIHADNAFDIKAKVILEGANGAVTPRAEQILRGRGITVVPDVVANGGGLVLSYLEWVQDLSMLAFDAHEVHERLRAFIAQTLQDVMGRSNALGGDLRAGAYVLALERINEASRLRGVYP